jgi:hypothetical protein
MSIQEYIEESLYIQKIILDVELAHFDTDEAIRYVTVMISKQVKRDPKFFLLKDEAREEMFKKQEYNTYPYVICKTLHELIQEVLGILGIESRVVVATNTRIPLYALIVDGKNNRYFIDALHDLFRSQYNIEPVCYGAHIKSNGSILDEKALGLVTLPLEYIREMDLKTGLIQDEYFSDYIKRIQPEFIDRNKAKIAFGITDSYELLKTKMAYNSQHFLNLYPVEGPIERTALHVYLRTNLFNKSERNNFYVGNRIDKEGNPVFIQIKFGSKLLTYEEVCHNEEYSLIETTDSLVPTGVK